MRRKKLEAEGNSQGGGGFRGFLASLWQWLVKLPSGRYAALGLYLSFVTFVVYWHATLLAQANRAKASLLRELVEGCDASDHECIRAARYAVDGVIDYSGIGWGIISTLLVLSVFVIPQLMPPSTQRP